MGIRTKLSSMGYDHIVDSWDGKSFSFRIDTQELSSNNYILPFYKDYGVTKNTYINPITIDWGDGSSPEEFSSDNPSHTYSEVNNYIITIYSETGKMPLPRLGTYDNNESGKAIKEVLTPLMECYILDSLATDSYKMFDGVCSYTKSDELFKICKKFFIKNPQLTKIRGLFSNSKLESIPSDLFYYTPNLEDVSSCFYRCQIGGNKKYIIPEHLFDKNPLLKKISQLFQTSTNKEWKVSIPTNIFSFNKNITNANGCFLGQSGITTELPHLWELNTIAYSNQTFYSCYNASNFLDVPYSFTKNTLLKINSINIDNCNVEFTSNKNSLLLLDNYTAISTFYDDTISLKVSKEGYGTRYYSINNDKSIIDVTLNKRDISFTINPTPEDCNIEYILDDVIIKSNTINVANYEVFTYKVYKDGFNSLIKTITIDTNTNLNLALKKEKLLINISNPIENTNGVLDNLIINGDYIISEDKSSIDSKSSWASDTTGYITLPLSNNKNINFALNLDYNCTGTNLKSACAVYLGNSPYFPTKYQIGNNTTDGNGEYVFSYHEDLSSLSSGTFNNDFDTNYLKNDKDYILSFIFRNSNDGNMMSIKTIKITADQPDYYAWKDNSKNITFYTKEYPVTLETHVWEYGNGMWQDSTDAGYINITKIDGDNIEITSNSPWNPQVYSYTRTPENDNYGD